MTTLRAEEVESDAGAAAFRTRCHDDDAAVK